MRVAALVATVALAVVAVAAPTSVVRNGLLTYDVWEDGQHTIEVVAARGGSPRALAPESTDNPSWSPDGREIAHSVQDAPGACKECWDIDVTNANGSRSRQLTHGGANGDPSWSPDGTLIAYSHSTNAIDAPIEIWVVSPDGSGARRLVASSRSRDFFPTATWSPDGRTLGLTTLTGGLYLINASGHGLHRLTGMEASFPQFAPNGKLIAFTHSTSLPDRGVRDDIYLIGVDGKGLHRLGGRGIQRSSPAWSPDGKQIAFVGGANPNAATYNSAIYTIRVNGSGQRRLTRAQAASNPAWSPDGKLIAFTSPSGTSLDNWRVLVMSANRSRVRIVSGARYAWAGSYVLWQPQP